jgi:hypothetical protein
MHSASASRCVTSVQVTMGSKHQLLCGSLLSHGIIYQHQENPSVSFPFNPWRSTALSIATPPTQNFTLGCQIALIWRFALWKDGFQTPRDSPKLSRKRLDSSRINQCQHVSIWRTRFHLFWESSVLVMYRDEMVDIILSILEEKSMGCFLDRGLDVLPNNASQNYVKLHHQVSNCASLFPKEQLFSTAATTTPVVLAVARGTYNVTRIPHGLSTCCWNCRPCRLSWFGME